MSWFNNSFREIAQDALSKAQASIDAALEIEADQDPLHKNDSTSAPKTTRSSRPKPSSKLSTTTKPAATGKQDDWGAWGSSTMNTLWTGAGSLAAAQASSSGEATDNKRKKSNALKLGQKRAPRTSPGSSPRTPRGVGGRSNNPSRPVTSTPNQSIDLTADPLVLIPKAEEVSRASSPSVEQISEEDLPTQTVPQSISIPTESKLMLLPDASLPFSEPSISKCSSSSAISAQMSTSSTSTLTSSIHTVPGDIGAVAAVAEDSSGTEEDSVRDLRTPHKDHTEPHKDHTNEDEGWSENVFDENKSEETIEESVEDNESAVFSKECREERTREISKESLGSESLPGSSGSDDGNGERCLSIGSSGNSSSVQLIQSQCPSDTEHISTNHSEDSEVVSDEDTRTPTNQGPVISAKLDLVHQTIDEESGKDLMPASVPKKMRIITSPVSSEHSDFVVLNEGSPASTSPREMSEILKVKEVLHAREQRLFTMSQENAVLQDEVVIERQRSSDLERQLAVLSDKHSNTVQEYQEELDAVEELRNHIEEELQVLKQAGDIEELVEELKAKDELIAELEQEGEKLSQTSFNSQNHVKKLRAKEKEDEKIIKDQRVKIEGLEKEVERLKGEAKANKECIKEKDTNTTELSNIISTQTEELSTIKSKLEDLALEKAGLKSNLDKCYKQITELQQANLCTQSKIEKETMSASLRAQEEALSAVQSIKEEAEQQKKMMSSQVEELQEMVARLEQQSIWKEQRHRDQMQELHIRIEDAVGRNQDISSSISSSTQPLLRQIQLLQESHSAQQTTWDRVEKSLNERLEEARTELSVIEGEKRDMTEKIQTLNSKLRTAQTQLESTRSSKSQLEVELEVVTSRVSLLEEDTRKEGIKSEHAKCQYLQSLTESKNYAEKLKTEIDMLRLHLLDAEKDEEEVSIASRSSTPPSEMSSQTFILERSLGGHYTSSPLSPSPNAHSSYAVEKLSSQLKHSQGEIRSYQEQIRVLELSKSSLSTELTKLSGGYSDLEKNLEDYPKVKKANKELQTRYDTLLQMYGEKAEEVHELQLDLADVKEAYKAQIEQLLSKVIR